MMPRSWEHWKERYERHGQEVLTPAYADFEVAVEALREDSSPIDAGSNSSAADVRATLRRVLAIDDLMVLIGWAVAVVEPLAHAPERLPALVADARPGAAWRSELGIAEPSQRIVESFESLDETVQAARAADKPTFEAVLAASVRTGQARRRSTSWCARCCDRSSSNSGPARQCPALTHIHRKQKP